MTKNKYIFCDRINFTDPQPGHVKTMIFILWAGFETGTENFGLSKSKKNEPSPGLVKKKIC